VCVVLTARGNYAKLKTVIEEITSEPSLQLQVVVGGSLVLDKYGRILDDKESIEFPIDHITHFVIEGENPLTMAKSAGLAVSEFATAFEQLKPDIVLVLADRFECLSIAMAATYLNITVAHLEGGERTGSIDESVRHAITKLAHIHVPASIDAAKRIARLGEDSNNIFHVGSSSLDALNALDLSDLSVLSEYKKQHGVGSLSQLAKRNYLLVIFHPVTTEYYSNYEYVNQCIEAIKAISMPTIWIWPNMDAGSDGISKAIREFRESGKAKNVYFFKSIPIEIFGAVLSNAGCVVGNSSCGIRESAFLGTPSVNIGNRQQGRHRADNVVNVGHSSSKIIEAVKSQISHGPYESDYSYGRGGTAKQIVEILSTINVSQQKKNTY
jgi:UDP-hydrolysing UDP-N-acetyl-D-glucosamine 2-epimerase